MCPPSSPRATSFANDRFSAAVRSARRCRGRVSLFIVTGRWLGGTPRLTGFTCMSSSNLPRGLMFTVPFMRFNNRGSGSPAK